jgi:hypothetical protein
VERKGKVAVLFNSESYSVTTSGQQHSARVASRQYPQFTVDNMRESDSTDHKKTVESYIKKATEAQAKAIRARKEWSRDHYNGSALALLNEARAYCEFFGISARKIPDSDHLLEASARMAKRDAEKVRKENKERRERDKEAFSLWEGGASYCPQSWRLDPDGGVRMRISGDELQTAHGASVPLAHAIRAFRFIKLCKERGEGWQRNGHSVRVGHFTLDRINPDGSFVAGCHKFSWAEVQRVAQLAKVADIAPEDTRDAV